MNKTNSTQIRLILVYITILFLSFSGWSAPNSYNSYELPVEFTAWQYSEDPRGMQTLGRFSNNYYLVNGQKIALFYGVEYWPNSGVRQTTYLIGISLSNLTKALDPTYNGNMNIRENIPRSLASFLKTKQIRVKWLNNNTTETIAINMVKNDVLLIFNPYSVNFQKKFNRNKKLCITIEISTGEKLDFILDLTDPIPTI